MDTRERSLLHKARVVRNVLLVSLIIGGVFAGMGLIWGWALAGGLAAVCAARAMVNRLTRTDRRAHHLAPIAWLLYFAAAIAVIGEVVGQSLIILGVFAIIFGCQDLWTGREEPGYVRMYSRLAWIAGRRYVRPTPEHHDGGSTVR